MQGRRREDEISLADLEPGDYCLHTIHNGGREFGSWWLRSPLGDVGRLCMPEDVELGNAPSHHVVVEHEDGSISVTPQPTPPQGSNSIRIVGLHGEWHRYLYAGEWRPV